MQPLLRNKFFRFGIAGVVILLALSVLAMIVLASLNDARSTGYSDSSMGLSAPSFSNEMHMRGVSSDGMVSESDYYYPSEPAYDNYTSGLESYETTQYSVNSRTRQFDELCSTIKKLKADPNIHFKYLTTSTNNCYSTFYVEENKVENVLTTLTAFKGVEVNRNTSSVTRHREQIQTQTSILKQQLQSVESSLNAAETQFDEIAEFARESKDASTLAQAITQKINSVDMLTQRKINLASQLNQLYKQAADLEERINVVQFDVTINRSHPIYPEQNSRKWEQAWEELKDTYTNTLIGISTYFGIFLLWVLRLSIYLVVLIVILRGLWKFIQVLREKW